MNPCDSATADFAPPLSVFRYFVSRASAVYVSTPITTGVRFLKWYETTGRMLASQPELYREAHAKNVIAQNYRHAADAIRTVKLREHPAVVIDPTAFEFPGWSQSDYHCFWEKVILNFARKVVFLDGWEASVGCVHEFNLTSSAGIEAVDESNQPIQLAAALERILSMIRTSDRLGLSMEQIRAAYQDLLQQETGSGSPLHANGSRS